MKARIAFAALAATAAVALTPGSAAAFAPADSLSTAIGVVMGEAVEHNLNIFESQGITINRMALAEALSSWITGGHVGMTVDQADSIVSEALSRAQNTLAAANLAAQQAFIDAAAAADGAVTTPSGLVFSVITEGEGPFPTDDDQVLVDYTGRLADGTVFDSTAGAEPATFPVGRVVAGFAEGLKMMHPGGTYRITIPAALAYGERGVPGHIPPGAVLQFDVTLHRIYPATNH